MGIRNSLRRGVVLITLLIFSISLGGTARGDLTIILVGDDSGAPGNTTGDGNLSDIMRAAADTWEFHYRDSTTLPGFSLVINYSWGPLSGSTIGRHSPNDFFDFGSGVFRETEGTLTFDNKETIVWFLDPTPLNHNEYTNLNESSANFGGGSMIFERFYDSPTGDAVGAIDLYTVAVHEIGHALGLSSGNAEFIREARDEGDDTVELLSPLPFTGSVLQVEEGSAHLEFDVFGKSVMVPSVSFEERRIPSHADMLCNGELSKYNAIRLAGLGQRHTDNLTVFRGLDTGGSSDDSFNSDNQYRSFQPGFTLNSTEPPVWLIAESSLQSDSPVTLNVTLEASANTPGLTQVIEVFNWSTNSYQQIDQRGASFNSDAVANVDLTGMLSDVVQTGSGAVTSRFGWRRSGFTILYPWQVNVDQIVWTETN